MRHSFASQALVNGVGIAHVAELLGHVDTSMVSSHYAHPAGNIALSDVSYDHGDVIFTSQPDRFFDQSFARRLQQMLLAKHFGSSAVALSGQAGFVS
jgi:hypothetical protein